MFNRRSLLRGGLALGTVAAASACGFAPAYGPNGGAQRLQNRILITEPTDRDAYFFVQHLEDRLGRANAPRYGLSYELRLTEERMAIAANNITARFNLIGRATFSLTDINSEAVLATGAVDSFTGYSATGTTVATQAAARDARERLMTILADQLTTRLIAVAPSLPV